VRVDHRDAADAAVVGALGLRQRAQFAGRGPLGEQLRHDHLLAVGGDADPVPLGTDVVGGADHAVVAVARYWTAAT
jgi:hypothetical protein